MRIIAYPGLSVFCRSRLRLDKARAKCQARDNGSRAFSDNRSPTEGTGSVDLTDCTFTVPTQRERCEAMNKHCQHQILSDTDHSTLTSVGALFYGFRI